MAQLNLWTREQLIVVLNLYCKIPFSKAVTTNPDVIRIGNIIGRSPGSVAMKLGNFASFDPELKKRGIGGLANASKLDQEIWIEFNSDWENLAYESEVLIAALTNQSIEQAAEINVSDLPLGKERLALIKQRVNQNFFRSTILSSYNVKCCITGLSIPDFLVASHIVPWAKDEKNRLNPRNGLCLNSIHDRAFDKGYITITPDFKLKVSKFFNNHLQETAIDDLFIKYNNRLIILPDKFTPNQDFLDYHYKHVFIN